MTAAPRAAAISTARATHAGKSENGIIQFEERQLLAQRQY
jgi:hypothetical protein